MDFNVNFGKYNYTNNQVLNRPNQTISFKGIKKEITDTFESHDKSPKTKNGLKTAAKIGMFLALGPILGTAALVLKNKIDKQEKEQNPEQIPEPVSQNSEEEPIQQQEEKPSIEESIPQTETQEIIEESPIDETPAVEKTQSTHEIKEQKQKGAKLKKSDFKGIDYTTVEKYRVDISKFKSTGDLQDWAEEKIKTITEKDFGGRQQETKWQRRAMLKEWIDYVTKENDGYTPVMQLAILDAITKDLKPKTDDIPPVLNKGVLADTMAEVTERLKANPKDNININKLYQTKLRAISAVKNENGESKNDYTGWVEIPSKIHDPEHFAENVDRLKTLSHKNWCTKSFNAEPYLSDGDFHVYLENGEPKLGVRFVGDEIEEIQGELNNSKIPQKYFGTAKQHIEDENLKLRQKADKEIQQAELVKKEIDKIKNEIGEDAIKNEEYEKIMPYFGIEAEKDEDGMITLSKYHAPEGEITYEDLDIDENKLFKKVKTIKGDANFWNTTVTDLGNLQSIEGDAKFHYSKIKSLGKLQTISGNASFHWSEIETLGQLQSIGGDADLNWCALTDLGDLRTVGGDFNCLSCKFTSLGKLKSIGGNFKCNDLKDLGELESIGGNGDFKCSELHDLGKLKTIGGNADFEAAKFTSLGQLESIGGNANLGHCSKINDLGHLKRIGRDADFEASNVTDMGELESIGGNAKFRYYKKTNFRNLKTIGGNALIDIRNIQDIKNIDVKGQIDYHH